MIASVGRRFPILRGNNLLHLDYLMVILLSRSGGSLDWIYEISKNSPPRIAEQTCSRITG